MSLRGHLAPGPGPGERLSLTVLSSTEIDNHIQVLQENKHEEEKLRSIQEIWDKYEVYAMNSNYYHPLERFVKAMLAVLNETSPHFLMENSVQKLRCRTLELILRMSNHEAIKNSVKDVSKAMLRLLQLDNEKNAILALKILNEIWRSNKIYFLPEKNFQISAATNFLKNVVKDMSMHVNNGMFDVRDWSRSTHSSLDDNLIENYLDTCWHVQPISVLRQPGTEGKVEYNLIPRSSMSLKLIQDLSNFFVYIYQHHKQTMNNDCMDFLVICLEFICLQLPSNYKDFTGVLKETMDDFHLAQSRMLTHITVMGKIVAFQEVLVKNANNVINAVLTLLETLDDKSVSTRKEVMVALKFIFCSDMKSSVIRFLPRLLDEDSILGKGFTSRDNLRTFMYQSLADLLHHIRYQMSFPLLLQASSIFCRQMNDPTISFQTQVMCVRLLCSICEALPKMEQQGEATRDILWQILDNLAYKLERLATYHLPLLVRQNGLEDTNGRRILHHEMLKDSQKTQKKREIPKEMELIMKPTMSTDSPEEEKQQPSTSSEPPLPPVEKSSRHTQPDVMLTNLNAINSPAMTVPEARNYVKYLLQTVRSCCNNIQTSSRSNLSYPVEKERDIMESLLKYGLICMDVFMLVSPGPKQVVQAQRCKEEKEALDGFANIFISMDAHVYKEIFAKHINLIIERIHTNPTVQLFANAFLVRSDFVCKFGGIMIRYLMENMDKLAVSTERTALYVKLFKIIFSAIGCGNAGVNPRDPTTEGELMLKPYLSDLIRKATEYALTAKEPLNYFLLLRALFRSIGGGAHDILYGQFLPLLPNLLHFLNKLQSCNSRLQMRELFLELCLTVPVRLSSLLPYLPLLMDPLVCALNGTTTLVQQGLRTLELCVDNLQPEYLFEHMAPVRSALIQGLWRVLSTSADNNSSSVAFRILGKFGGANRRILHCPQSLNWVQDHEFQQMVITLEFPRAYPEMPIIRGELTLTEIISLCLEQMGHLCYRIPRIMAIQPDSTGNVVSLMPYSMATNATQMAQNHLVKDSCMELAKSVLVALFAPDGRTNLQDFKQNLADNLKETIKRIDYGEPSKNLFKATREYERKVVIQSLNIIMMGVIQKELRPKFVNFYMTVVRQLALQGLMEAATSSDILGNPYRPTLCLDSTTLIDAISNILIDINKDFLSSAVFALAQINEVADVCISNKERWIEFPFLRYMMDTVIGLCYGTSWCSKLGGANGLFYLIKHLPKVFLACYHQNLVEGLMEVIIGLSDEISSGACEMALQSTQALHERLLKGYDLVQDPNGYVRTKLNVYIPKLFKTTFTPRNTIWELMLSMEKENEIITDLSEILAKNVDLIQEAKASVTQNLRSMSMMEQECSLSALNLLLDRVPHLVGFDFNDGSLESFFDTVFDLCETDVQSLLQRDSYKAMENCTAHFLPPSPISTQMESLRAIAVNTLIYGYKILCLDNHNADERKSFFAKRVLTIAVKSALHGSESMQNSVTETLKKCNPVPLEYLTAAANQIVNSFNDGNGDVESVVKMEKLISFNHELWSKDLAIKFVDQIQSWQTTSPEDGFPSRCANDILGIQAVMRLILRGEVLDFEMVMKLVNFIAFFELNYTTDTDFGWIPSLCELISYYPLEMIKVFCSKEFLGYHTAFLCRILEQEGAKQLRQVLKDDPVYVENLIQLKTLEKGSWERYIAKDLETLNVYEESILRIVDTVVEKEPDWFEGNHQLIEQMRRIWTTPEFKDRYSIAPVYIEEDNRKLVRVQTFPASKLNVPHLFGKCFVRYLKKNHDALDLLFDVMLAFDGCFATDFGFIRDFLEHDVIPTRSIPWRVRCFETILDRLSEPEDAYLKNSLIARMIQYVIHPCLQFVFERYPCSEILGPGLPGDEETTPDANHCMARLTNLIDKHKNHLSEQNTIAMYQLCTLLVEYAPNHIHNNDCKKQGTRLRVFMVFVWTTLTSSTSNYMIDPTVRFTGYLFLAHLIDKFNISRKIVLQVFNTLLMQYQLDNRDLVRKAIDVVTPAVPVRLQDDGNQQLLVHVKKILTEEAQNIAHISHVVFSITRNYKVYYNIRNEIIPTLISIAIRVLQAHNYGTSEGHTIRRMSLDICEMAVKWELLRHHRELRLADPDYIGIESMLEVLKTNERDEKDETERKDRVTTISKEHIDTIINLLLKFACTMFQLQHQMQTSNTASPQFANQAIEMGRRALGLLRAALKPGIWGDITGIKYPWLEKQLTIPTEYARNDGQHHAYAQHIATAQQTMETLLQLSSSMSRSLLLSVLKPLQRALITCMMQTSQGAHQLVKSINYLLQKLFEKSKLAGIANGLEELETLNQYIIKYLNDHFTNYYKTPNAMISVIFSAFSVLRSICAHYPSYLDNTCLATFLKVMEKVVRDHMHTHAPHPDAVREKSEDSVRRERVLSATIDFISVGLELLRLRVAHIGVEHRRQLCQNILLPLIDKCVYDKVVDCLIKITHEILITHTDRNSPNPGLPLAVRLHAQCERRFLKLPKDPNQHQLMPPYLAMILVIFENPIFKNSEAGAKMTNAFYWGLMSPDPTTRNKFLACWEKSHEPFVLTRLMAILKDESWHHFRKYNWLRHAIWLMLQSCVAKPFGEYSSKRPIHFGDSCCTWFRTIEQIVVPTPSLGATSMDCTVASSFSSPGQTQESTASQPQTGETMDTSTPVDEKDLPPIHRLVDGQIKFFEEIIQYESSHLLTHVYNLMFNTTDQKFTPKIFIRLFVSIWYNLLPEEKQDFQNAIIPFLTSGVHNGHLGNSHMSVLVPWMEAIDQTGEIKLPPKLLHFISKSHLAWHKGLLILERETRYMEMAYEKFDVNQRRSLISQAYGENENTPYREALDYLAMLYKDMEELDAYAAIWDRRAIKQETVDIFNHLQRGEIKEAFKDIENTICEAGDVLSTAGNGVLFTPPLEQELNLLYDEYAHCCEELLDWEKLKDYANHGTSENLYLAMKCAMHFPDWNAVRECLDQLSGCMPPQLYASYQIYQMMGQIMGPLRRDHSELMLNQPVQNIQQYKTKIEKIMDEAINYQINTWRGLPSVVSNSHVKILQASSVIREIADCIDMRIALDANNSQTYSSDFLNQVKHVTKVWRNRLCAIQDELSFQAFIYDWRTQVHHMAMRRLEEWDQAGVLMPLGTSAQLILPVHSSAQGQMYMAKAAKAMRLYDLAIDILNKLHTVVAVPALDAHNKICDQLKIIRLQAERTSDPKQRQDFYQLGLHMINETNLTFFAPDQVSRLFTLRGQFLSGLDKREEAVKVFSLATQIVMEKQPTMIPTNAFKCWGDHQDKVLQNDQTELSAMTAGAGGMSCFFEVARGIDNDNRAKKYIGKLLWTSKQMIASGDIATIRVDDIIDKNERTTIPYNWLCWLPQLINDVRQRPTSNFTKILSRICEDFPLQIFYHLRCAFPPFVTDALIQEFCQNFPPLQTDGLDPWVQALIPIMRQAITMRPPDCRAFNTFLNELNTMKEFWAERQYRFALNVRNEITRAMHLQNQQGMNANDFYLDQDCINSIHIWRDDFERNGQMIFMKENELKYSSTEMKPRIEEDVFICETSEMIRKFFEGCPCPVGQVIRYLDSLVNITKELHNRIQKLPKNISLKLSSPWLADFTNRVGCIEMPRDLFNVQKTVGSNGRITFPSPFSSKDQQYTASQYCSMIARVEAFYSVTIEGGEAVKKLSFKSTNGKCCFYYLKKTVKQKIGVENCNKFLDHMNHLLTKERETARRYLAAPILVQLQIGYGCSLIETAHSLPGDTTVEMKMPLWHPTEILGQKLQLGMQPDDAVIMFYNEVFREIDTKVPEVARKKDMLERFEEEHFIGQRNLLDFFMRSYPDATHFYSFRKQIARHMAVFNILEFLLKLTPPKLQDIYITRNYGQYIVPNYAFQVAHKQEQRSVPFRLTSNFQTLLGYSVDGDLRWSAESTITCLRYRKPEIFLRPLLYDFITEMMPGTYKDHVTLVNRMIFDLQCRVKNYDTVDLPPGVMRMQGVDNLIRDAVSKERIALMDPALYPWF